MSFSPIIIIGGEPQSIFIEILLKSLKKIQHPIILITSKKILVKNLKKFNYKIKLNQLNSDFSNIKKNKVNLVNINYNKFSFLKKKITSQSNSFIVESFNAAIKIIKKINCLGIINGPISKKTFLKGRHKGITEFLAKKIGAKNPVMLIYNKKLSVSPLTTHMPISKVSRYIKKKDIIVKVSKINSFYLKFLKKNLGLQLQD